MNAVRSGIAFLARQILHGFRNVTNLNGRDRRRTFWPYAVTLFFLMIPLMFVVLMLPAMVIGDEFLSSPGRATFVYGSMAMAIVYLVPIALAFAACVRRLHDSGASMLTVIVAFAPTVIFLLLFPVAVLFLDFDADPTSDAQATAESTDGGVFGWALRTAFVLIFAGSIGSMFAFFWMLVLLLRPGSKTTNGYGPPPIADPSKVFD